MARARQRRSPHRQKKGAGGFPYPPHLPYPPPTRPDREAPRLRALEREPKSELADALFGTTEVAREGGRLQQRRIRARPVRRHGSTRVAEAARVDGVEQVEDLADRFDPRASAETEQPSRRGCSSACCDQPRPQLTVSQLPMSLNVDDCRCPCRSVSTANAFAGISVASPSRFRSRPSIRSTGSAER